MIDSVSEKRAPQYRGYCRWQTKPYTVLFHEFDKTTTTQLAELRGKITIPLADSDNPINRNINTRRITRNITQ